MIVSYIFINCHSNSELELAEFLRGIDIVEEVMITTGDNDIICRILTNDLDELYTFTSEVLENRDEIKSMRTSVVMKEIIPE